VALIASAHPSLRHHPGGAGGPPAGHGPLGEQQHPTAVGTDTSPGDLTGLPCDTGFCHLGGPPISNRNAYGAGLAYVANP